MLGTGLIGNEPWGLRNTAEGPTQVPVTPGLLLLKARGLTDGVEGGGRGADALESSLQESRLKANLTHFPSLLQLLGPLSVLIYLVPHWHGRYNQRDQMVRLQGSLG